MGVSLQKEFMRIGFHGTRQDIPLGAPFPHVAELIREAREASEQAVFIVGGWQGWHEGRSVQMYKSDPIPQQAVYAQAFDFAKELQRIDWAPQVEIGNEPDITDGFSKDPATFAGYVRRVWEEIVIANPALEHRCYMGGVSNLRKKAGHKYLTRLLQHADLAEDKIMTAFHPYRPEYEPWAEFGGWSRINDAVWELRQVWGERQFGVTEIGWHTATQKRGLLGRHEWQWTDEQVAEFYQWERNFWQSEGAQCFVWYQLNDGPDDTSEHKFGIRYLDETYKPVAYVI
jgi:hypothetical protein